MLPLACSASPLASSDSLPTAFPTAFLALPLVSWTLFLALSVALTAVPSPRRLSVPGPVCPEGTVLIRLARPAGVGSSGRGVGSQEAAVPGSAHDDDKL